MCNGINCFDHGEDETTCSDNGGMWEQRETCTE
eukprot:COSAG06_NODE_37267_length_437_cov_0.857988_2_plen_32_part_01